MRNAFADEVTQLAKIDKRVVLLSGDIGNKLFDEFKRVDPKRFYNCGVAEANMMGVASGMALAGLRPIVYTITPFTTTRCFEQIRIDVCYHEAPVIIVGTGSGLSYAELGPTHHSLEDMAILRTLPGINVCAPGDANELRAILRVALKDDKPYYIRIGKKGEPLIHPEPPNFCIGKAFVIKKGKDILLLSTGTVLSESLKAREFLKIAGISAEIVSFPTIKPLDTAYLKKASKRFKLFVSIEEHGLIGGFGSTLLEWAASENLSLPWLRFGTPDTFMHKVGSQEYAREKYGLTGKEIAKKIMFVLQDTK